MYHFKITILCNGKEFSVFSDSEITEEDLIELIEGRWKIN